MVNSITGTKLFTPENVNRFAKKKCKILYTILGAAIEGAHEDEYSTVSLALSPNEAIRLCEECDGDAIEVWVVDGLTAVLSEKWDPQYFRDNFADIVNCASPDSHRDNFDDDVDEPDEDDTPEEGSIGIEMPHEILLGKSLLEILECEQLMSKTTAMASYIGGHPIDVEGLLNNLHASVAGILKAFAESRGGFEPRLRKKGGVTIPYWTKTQIRQAKSKSRS